jgi:hypothetical protein
VHEVTQGFALCITACTAKDYKSEKRWLFWPFNLLRISDRPLDFSITDPNEMEGDGRPNLFMFNGLQGFAFDLNLPINGEWSDLTVQFKFIKKGKGYYSVILNDIRVL